MRRQHQGTIITVRLAVRLLLGAIALLPLSSLAETISVGGVGSLSPLLNRLGEAYTQQHPGVKIIVMHPPLGTSGGMRALAAGKVDIVLAGRELKGDETGLVRPWLQTPLVLATFGGKTSGLDKQQLADIIARRKTHWDDGKPIRLIMRGASESETLALRAMSPEIDLAVGETLKRPSVILAENDIDAIEAIARITGSFGTTTLGLLKAQNASVDAVAINGQTPSLSALLTGSYPFARRYSLVTRTNPAPEVNAFVSFLDSAQALTMARQFEYAPAK